MYVIVGANGFLGSYIINAVLKNTSDNIVAISRHLDNVITYGCRVKWLQCDITIREQVDKVAKKINQFEKCNIIYLASYHHPDMVEKNPKIAWNVNVTSLAYFINSFQKIRCFFYPSSDTVYGNGNIDYHFKEEDELNPVNLYGKQKITAEYVVKGYGYNIVRYPFLIAPSLLKGKEHFYDEILKTIKQGNSIEMFDDSLRSTLDFGTAAELLVELIKIYNNDMPKVLNLSGDDDLSKYDVGLMIAKKNNISKKYIIPISAEKAAGIFEAKRAKSTLLDNTKVKKVLGLEYIKINL